MSTILVVAAHPDDETLGCGGTMARLAAEGHDVHLLVLADGETSREATGRKEAVDTRQAQCRAAATRLGVAGVTFAEFADQRLDQVALIDLAAAVRQAIESHWPNHVYAHWAGDLNQDHQAVARATLIATRPQPGCSVREVYAYPVASSTEWNFGRPTFAPNVFVDISATLETKMAAMQCYASEMRPWPHPRSSEAIRADAHRWGSVAGVEAAEALLLLCGLR